MFSLLDQPPGFLAAEAELAQWEVVVRHHQQAATDSERMHRRDPSLDGHRLHRDAVDHIVAWWELGYVQSPGRKRRSPLLWFKETHFFRLQ